MTKRAQYIVRIESTISLGCLKHNLSDDLCIFIDYGLTNQAGTDARDLKFPLEPHLLDQLLGVMSISFSIEAAASYPFG